jgi:hypothetical protein
MKNGLFEYGDQVIISSTDEKGIVNINQLHDGDMVEVAIESGEVKQYSEDDLAYDEDYQPNTGE